MTNAPVHASVLWARLERCQHETERRAVRLRRAAAASGLTASTITSMLAALQSGMAAVLLMTAGGGALSVGLLVWAGRVGALSAGRTHVRELLRAAEAIHVTRAPLLLGQTAFAARVRSWAGQPAVWSLLPPDLRAEAAGYRPPPQAGDGDAAYLEHRLRHQLVWNAGGAVANRRRAAVWRGLEVGWYIVAVAGAVTAAYRVASHQDAAEVVLTTVSVLAPLVAGWQRVTGRAEREARARAQALLRDRLAAIARTDRVPRPLAAELLMLVEAVHWAGGSGVDLEVASSFVETIVLGTPAGVPSAPPEAGGAAASWWRTWWRRFGWSLAALSAER